MLCKPETYAFIAFDFGFSTGKAGDEPLERSYFKFGRIAGFLVNL